MTPSSHDSNPCHKAGVPYRYYVSTCRACMERLKLSFQPVGLPCFAAAYIERHRCTKPEGASCRAMISLELDDRHCALRGSLNDLAKLVA